ncbi:hypothetical protein BGW36DRAFT_356284 [Talaromyces proteolyticus]|uniref:CID domain-containing protein n=1 Tax=Talaromyces proteolyticus TaxID=1131652 RepID=A0AAD4KVT6_9EURO|nr:uncharacterized protein BGW36DRAFT_356284 [Talaromyces proteolyticus]KAH8702148.1 hypothetical protein BGW36DRAFT_356284 [Talaromyces proteolyticus]
MAAHQLAIAKASFSAALLRPDPSTVPRDDIVAFHALLDKALSHCSQTNVQTCKEWLLHYVVSSSNRANVLGKYLAALSESFKPPSQQEEQPGGRGPPGKRSRLHILYLLNDIFHHTKYHTNNGPGAFVAFSGALQPHVLELLGFAASYDRNKNPKHHRRLDQLLDIWSNHGYYSADYIDKLREAVKNSESIDAIKASVGLLDGVVDVQSKGPRRDAPYMMPATHGDPSLPYYDLPAGNFVPHIIPDSTAPIRPDMVKPLQFMAGPADKKLVDALQTFFNDVDRIYGVSGFESSENTVIDVDELGQPVLRNERGDIMAGDTYYGWSRDFCVQMKKRKAKGSSRSRSRNRRSRYSDSNSSDYDRISRSRSRSNSRDRRRYSRSQSRSRANSHGQPSRRSRSRSESYSPKPATPPSSFPNPHQGYQQQPPQPPYSFNHGSGFPPPYNGNIPPPPPHNFTDHRPQQGFPPPPPPIPSFPQSAPLMPPDTSSFPQPYQNRNQPGQYGGPQQMPPGSFPPPWQGGHQGGYNQGNGRW